MSTPGIRDQINRINQLTTGLSIAGSDEARQSIKEEISSALNVIQGQIKDAPNAEQKSLKDFKGRIEKLAQTERYSPLSNSSEEG